MNGIFRGKVQGTVTVGERGQVVIPAEVREMFRIRPGDKLFVVVRPERRIVNLIRAEDFNAFLKQASRIISRLERKVSRKGR